MGEDVVRHVDDIGLRGHLESGKLALSGGSDRKDHGHQHGGCGCQRRTQPRHDFAS